VQEAASLDGPSLDASALEEDGLAPAGFDIRRGEVVQALVDAPVVAVLDERLDLHLELAWCRAWCRGRQDRRSFWGLRPAGSDVRPWYACRRQDRAAFLLG